MSAAALWAHFRRLLLGTVIEGLLESGVEVAFPSIQISFTDQSAFRVPRLDNYMRFHGELTATLLRPLEPASARALESRLKRAWPELLAVVDIPIGDRLTNDRNEVHVTVAGDRLKVSFDLEAD